MVTIAGSRAILDICIHSYMQRGITGDDGGHGSNGDTSGDALPMPHRHAVVITMLFLHTVVVWAEEWRAGRW